MWHLILGILCLLAACAAADPRSAGNGESVPKIASIPIEVDASLGNFATAQGLLAPTEKHRHEREKLVTKLRLSESEYAQKYPKQKHVKDRLLEALFGFTKYYEAQQPELSRLRKLYDNVPTAHKQLLEKTVKYSENFDEIDLLLKSNQGLCERVVNHALDFYGITREEVEEYGRRPANSNINNHKKSVSQSLKHIVRDWAEEGMVERNKTFTCILESLKPLLSNLDTTVTPRILVPGSGLGRLGYDIATAVPAAEVVTNEWSMYVNIVTRYIESMPFRNSEAVHPFVDSWSHHVSDSDMQQKIPFPDIDHDPSRVLLVEGDFTTAFSGEFKSYDMIVTYFFIDTARNLMRYFDTIQTLLKPGGYWINLGPLLYGSAPWVQLSLEDIVTVVEELGFRFLDTTDICGELTWPDRSLRTMEAVYSFDAKALTKSAYKAQFWIAQKK
ncbi:N2227-like protein-domain-containing protein [Stachybotrys elegans]|uniref:N2227-like protein-domain-containing protein n=1 Tax=Stachybotrys elegans TaxID=80388 RepID=A0A8K0WLX8_9HYPO|nr:N2227-like protein-domain-containing protein [Stachybotrys elegans]